MNILVVTPYVPYPLNSGGNQAFVNMLEQMAKEHNVSLLLRLKNKGDRHNCAELEKQQPNINIIAYTSSSAKDTDISGVGRYGQWYCKTCWATIRSLTRKSNRRIKKELCNRAYRTGDIGMMVRAMSTVFNGVSNLDNGYIEYVREEAASGKYDLVQVEFYELLQLVYALPKNIRKVFVHHEIRFIRSENEMNLFDVQTITARTKLEQEKGIELNALSLYDDIVVLTDTDKEILKKYLPEKNIYVSPAVTTSNISTQHFDFTPAEDLAFIGSESHIPNLDGLWWFTKEVGPYLEAKGFTGNVFVTGSWKEETQQHMQSSFGNIKFVGFQDNISTFLNGKISIVPIRIGSGMRMKVMDASVSLSPLITTSKGCEGLPLESGKHCLISDSPEEFAEMIIQLVNDKKSQEEYAVKANVTISSIMNADKMIQRRMELYSH